MKIIKKKKEQTKKCKKNEEKNKKEIYPSWLMVRHEREYQQLAHVSKKKKKE